MRFSVITIASAAVAAAGTNAIDVAEISGYEAIPKAATNKYSQNAPSAFPDFATGSFEPTYMPEEDLKPSGIQARSVASSSGTANSSPAADEPSDDSYEAFMEWMNARLTQGTAEQAEHSHVARSVAPSPSAKVELVTDGPTDDSYEAFVTWMESRYPKDFSEQVKQKIQARDIPAEPQHTTTAAAATVAPTDGPADESYEEFVHWMNSRYPQGISEQDELKNFARSLDGDDEYPSEDYHELNARSVDTDEISQDQEHEMPDWSLAWNEEAEHHLQARSAEDDYKQESSTSTQGSPINARAESESDYPYFEETFEEFLARQGFSPEQYAKDGKPTESHEEDPKPQVAVDSKPSVSEIPASPAAAPTPKPTSAVTSSATSLTSASQWSGPMSETATGSSSSATNVQARSVSSHYRFRHHSAHASNSGTASASSATSSTTKSRKGFLNLPW